MAKERLVDALLLIDSFSGIRTVRPRIYVGSGMIEMLE